jgi:crotonobetainyl-CoA:carnitine CoA-transferase CaiB-like acyl-CoA transferase
MTIAGGITGALFHRERTGAATVVDVSSRPTRAPEFNEHGDQILSDLGLDWDAIVDLKVRGVVG